MAGLIRSRDQHPWTEDWAFQRPAGSTTHSTGAIAVCPNCGAPAHPNEVGQCTYCRADITSRTAGWLATRTATTLAALVRAHNLMERRRGKMPTSALPAMPPPTGVPFQPPQQPPRAG